MVNLINADFNLGFELKHVDASRTMKRYTQIFLIFAMGLVSSISATIVYAQSQDEKFIEQVLETAERQSGLLQVYTRKNRKLLASIDSPSDWVVVRRDGPWAIVRFQTPVVPVWVSRQHVRLDQSQAQVTANLLNLRSRASVDSFSIGHAKRGYRSQVLSTKPDFIQIFAPTEFEFSIRASAIADGSQAKANWQTPKNTDSEVLSQQASKSTPQQSLALSESAKPSEKPSKTSASAATKQNTDPAVVDALESFRSERNNRVERQHSLAPGDAISLRVFGEEDLSVENVRIPGSGAVSFPLIGLVEVAGKTTVEVERIAAGLLSQGYVRNPRVSVSIFSYRPIFVRGAVASVGSYPYTEGLTVGNAIAIAGGAKKSALENGVSISRDGRAVAKGLPVDSDEVVRSGDVISIEEQEGVSEENTLYVYLHGEVANPGEYAFRRGLTVEKAIVLAGGFTIRASRGKITITRYDGVGENQEPSKLKRVKLFTPIEPGDIIDVGATWF